LVLAREEDSSKGRGIRNGIRVKTGMGNTGPEKGQRVTISIGDSMLARIQQLKHRRGKFGELRLGVKETRCEGGREIFPRCWVEPRGGLEKGLAGEEKRGQFGKIY